MFNCDCEHSEVPGLEALTLVKAFIVAFTLQPQWHKKVRSCPPSWQSCYVEENVACGTTVARIVSVL